MGLTGKALLANLNGLSREGTVEFYLHPATSSFPGGVTNYPYEDDLAALMNEQVRRTCARLTTGGYKAMVLG